MKKFFCNFFFGTRGLGMGGGSWETAEAGWGGTAWGRFFFLKIFQGDARATVRRHTSHQKPPP